MLREKQAENSESQKAHEGQEQGVDGDAVGLLEVFFAQASGKGGVDADACASSYGDHQVLCREGQGYGRQGVFADLGHEHAVYNVIKGLDQHGQHHGDGHGQDQLVDGHDPHFVFR